MQFTPEWLQYGALGLLAIFLILTFGAVVALGTFFLKTWFGRDKAERETNNARLDESNKFTRDLVDRTIASMESLASESNKSQNQIALVLQSMCTQMSAGFDKMGQNHDRQNQEHSDIRGDISTLRGDLGRRRSG